MTIKEGYDLLGRNYEEVLYRLRNEERIAKYAIKFLDDTSFATLKDALSTGDIETAFRAAHTLKGVCQNLSFTKLYESSNAITEELRTLENKDVSEYLSRVEEDYNRVISAIRQMKEESGPLA
ncbi:MAG: Hpt domain-containing protein [Bacillota bacterium]|nr:Hpt domain-containing protein [Bacillota bacterium]